MDSLRDLLHKIQTEDSEKAFRQLFDLQYDRLFRLSFYYLQNDDWAKEVAMDVLTDLWNNRHTMILPDDFARYTMVMVRNASINLWKKEQRHEHDDEAAADLTGKRARSVETQVEDEELFQVYENALEQLPPRCREVWQLVKEEGLSYAEVAQQMEISTKTVDAQMQKAVTYLRKQVGGYLERREKSTTTSSRMKMLLFFLLA
ncbi:MAG: RNA polymerase sigma-70 factor [Bacteroidales bacterium]|nr:RNA polymerase sigma-70 factor [Bacteroidales bacterium]